MTQKKEAPTATTLAVTGNFSEIHGTWQAWTETVPEHERDMLQSLVMSHDLTTHTGIAALSQGIIGAMFGGKLSPAVALAAKPWLELMLFSIVQSTPAAEVKRTVNVVVGELREKVERKPAKYITEREPTIIDAERPREPVRVGTEEDES